MSISNISIGTRTGTICLLVGTSSLAISQGGIRCTQSGKRVNVTRDQWLLVKAAILIHEPKRIAPFISDKGIIETSMSNLSVTRKPAFSISSKLVGKKEFLEGISKITFHEKTANTGNDEDYVFIYTWFGLTPYGMEGEPGKDAVSFHKRTDVWWSHNEGSAGRVRFVCEHGWLKIAEIKTIIPADP